MARSYSDPDEPLAIELLNRKIAGRLQIIVDQHGGIAECARALGFNWQRLHHYLKADRTLSAYTISLICARLDVSADWLILGRRK